MSILNLSAGSLSSPHSNSTEYCDIISWNCDGYFPKLQEIKLLITKYQPKIICLQETRINVKTVISIAGYRTIQSVPQNLNATGGIAILIKNGYDFDEIPTTDPSRTLSVKVYMERTIVITCVYFSPSQPVVLQDLLQLKINGINCPLIIVGDFNAHNTLWGSADISARGRLVEDFLDRTNMIVANNGKHTRVPYCEGQRFTAVDLCICDTHFLPIISWDVDDDAHNSDHLPNLIKFLNRSCPPSQRQKWKLDDVTWDSFIVNLNLSEIDLQQHIDLIIDQKTTLISRAADENFPKSSSKPKKPSVPWWNHQTEEAVKNRKKALSSFRRLMSRENLIAYKKANAISRKVINEAKRETWQSYVSSINSQTSSKEMWQKIRCLKGVQNYQLLSIRGDDGATITDQNEIANILAKSFAIVSSSQSYSDVFQAIKDDMETEPIEKPVSLINLEMNKEFQLIELEVALGSAKGKSAGPDNIPYAMYKKLSLTNKLVLLKIFNKIWMEDCFPSQWRESLVIPIKKKVNEASTPDNVRPIALENCDCKLVEKMVNNRLVWYLESQNLLSDKQAGFRRGRNTLTNLVILETVITRAFKQGQHVVAAFFDLTKAYDKLWKYLILKQLSKWNIGGHTFEFIRNFLSDRKFQVCLGETKSELVEQENGVPQGSVLSVTLFLIGMNVIAEHLSLNVNIDFLLYADDLVVYVTGIDVEESEIIMQTALEDLMKFALVTGFSFSPTKTKSILFSRKHSHAELSLNLTANGNIIETVNSYRFLGMILDKKLLWRSHINDLKIRTKKRLGIIKTLSNFEWGSDRKTLLLILNSMVISVLDYGCQLYDSAAPTYKKCLETVLNSGIRSSIGAFCSSPVKSLLCDVGMMNLNDRRKLKILHTIAKIKEKPGSALFHSCFQGNEFRDVSSKRSFLTNSKVLWNEYGTNSSIIENYQHTLPPWHYNSIRLDRRMEYIVEKSVTNENTVAKFLELKARCESTTFLYTDGSKIEDKTGYAVVAENQIIKCRTGKDESIFYVEAKAILRAILLAETLLEPNMVIATDSLSNIMALENPKNCDSITNLIRKKILNSNKCFTIMWVPSHIGIIGNEAADKAAKESLNGIVEDDSITSSDVQRLSLNKLLLYTNEKWRTSVNKYCRVKDSMHKWSVVDSFSRRDSIVITRLRIGHSRLTHGYHVLRQEPPICVCGVLLTISHILESCLFYQNLRRKHKISGQLCEILGEDPSMLSNLIFFLKEADLFKQI